MKTRMVRVRRRPGAVTWALTMMMAAAFVYVRVSLPVKERLPLAAADPGERVTREVEIEALDIWLISFGGYSTESGAKVEAARYVSRGAAGYILKEETLLEVIGAGYTTREEAETVCARLAAEEGLDCRIIGRSSSKVKLRITAGVKQIEAFLQAEQALRKAAGVLGQLAFSIDRQEANVEQARSVLRAQQEMIGEAAQALSMQMEKEAGGIFASLSALVEAAEEQIEELLAVRKIMALSSGLKHCFLDLTMREMALMNELNG